MSRLGDCIRVSGAYISSAETLPQLREDTCWPPWFGLGRTMLDQPDGNQAASRMPIGRTKRRGRSLNGLVSAGRANDR